MSRRSSRLFVIETVLAAASGFLFMLTLFWKDWIELLFHVDPDAETGTLEWLIAVTFLALALAFSALAQIDIEVTAGVRNSPIHGRHAATPDRRALAGGPTPLLVPQGVGRLTHLGRDTSRRGGALLRAEAAWLGRELERLPVDHLSPLLSVGSGDLQLRTVGQPWIQRLVFGPLAERGVRVLHHDLKPAAGVDVAGDLTDPVFLARLAKLGARSLICCNVLEHVPDAPEVAAALERSVAPGGYLLVTVPRRYPYHPGPIDTLFRPSVSELGALLPRLTVTRGEEIGCESLLGYLHASPHKLAAMTHGLRLAARRDPAPRPPARVPLHARLRMTFASTSVTALVLRAPE